MGIRSLVEKLKQKNDADRSDKEAKKREKQMIKESVKDKQKAEKEKKRLDRELKKERLQTEKEAKELKDEAIKEEKRREKEEAEMKKQQEEAERDQRRREKEEAEFRKQLKKQHEEAEREQRRREKEEAEMKRQSAIQKQATIMERFLKTSKSSNNSTSDKVLSTVSSVPDPSCKDDNIVGTTTFLMDQAFAQMDIHATEDLFKRSSSFQNRTRAYALRVWLQSGENASPFSGKSTLILVVRMRKDLGIFLPKSRERTGISLLS